jgi:hypothetical protein
MPQEPFLWTTILTLLVTPSTKPNRNSSFPPCRTRHWKEPLAAQAAPRPILKRASRRSVSGTPYSLRSSAVKVLTRDEARRIAAHREAVGAGTSFFHCASYAVGARFLTTHYLNGRQKKPRYSCRGLVWKNADVTFSDVCSRSKVNKFHSYVVFFNGLHSARPGTNLFLTLPQIPLVSAKTNN